MTRSHTDLLRQLAALGERFSHLGGEVAEAARELAEAGTPPPETLVDALAACREEFEGLRAQVAEVATEWRIGQPETTDGIACLSDLLPVLRAVGEAVEAEERRAALESVRQGAFKILDRVLGVEHRDDPGFPPLALCQAKARELRQTVVESPGQDVERETNTIADGIRVFADFLTMVDGGTIDDERWGGLEDAVTQAFGRQLAVAVSRGKLYIPSESPPSTADEPPPGPSTEEEPVAAIAVEPVLEMVREPVVEEAAVEPEPVMLESPAAAPVLPAEVEEPRLELVMEAPVQPEAAREIAVAPVLEAPPIEEPPAPPPAEEEEEGAPLELDETAQWWLAASASWSGLKSRRLSFADAVKEELMKYPYVLSVPIQRSGEYEDGLLSYGYALLLEHGEKQKAGLVNQALEILATSAARRDRGSLGSHLYAHFVSEGKLETTYPEFVREILLNAFPGQGVWTDIRIHETDTETRVFTRPSETIGDTEQKTRRVTDDRQRTGDHQFSIATGPLTARFLTIETSDLKEARVVEVKLTDGGTPSANAWLLTMRSGGVPDPKAPPRRVPAEGLSLPGLGKEYHGVWLAVFNPDSVHEKPYEVKLGVRRRAQAPSGKLSKTQAGR
ncbi:MAG: hypothetical protein HY727_09925 [Candidatus Rokubacteria bacterium]|nr:hypothetical protein [Candidatus Rokubacteria bacterium]